MNDYQVKLYNDYVKPIAVPPWLIPYHLNKAQGNNVIDSVIIKEGAIKKHPPNEPAHLVSCGVIVPKSDSSLCITLDACNLK